MRLRVLSGVLVTSFLAPGLTAERLTIPAVASIEGRARFFSDVRLFNTSYRDALSVSATYRCFLGSCPTAPPSRSISIGPRESLALDDICSRFFGAPGSGGAVELEPAGGTEGRLVVTSRLYSTAPRASVGMFVPGVGPGAAGRRRVLTSIRNGGSGPAFRTNVGMFNTTDTRVDVILRLFEDGIPVGSLSRSLGPRSGTQINDIFAAVDQPFLESTRGVVTVEASGDLVPYAAVIDGATTDPIFVLGAPDATPPPAPTPTPAVPTRVVNVGPGFQFVDQQTGGNVSTIRSGTTIEWVWVGGGHSTTSGPCAGSSCTPDGRWASAVQTDGTFRFHFTTPGTYPYFCDPHSDQMRGAVIVEP